MFGVKGLGERVAKRLHDKAAELNAAAKLQKDVNMTIVYMATGLALSTVADIIKEETER